MTVVPCMLLLVALSCVESISLPTKWTPVTSVPDGVLQYVISFQNTFLLMVGDGPVFTSTTGSDWVKPTIPSNETIFYSTVSEELGQVLSLVINDGDDSYLCYGPMDDLLQKCIGNSLDVGPDFDDLFYATYGKGEFMVSFWEGSGGTVLSIGENETTWQMSTELDPLVYNPPNSSFTFNLCFGGVVYCNKNFYVTSGDGFFQSTDGQQWNFINITVGYISGLVVANDNLYGYDFDQYLYHFDPESSEWTLIVDEPVMSRVKYNSGLYFATGASGAFYYSKDGLHFSLGDPIAEYDFVSIAYANGLYLAVAQNITYEVALTYLYIAQGDVMNG